MAEVKGDIIFSFSVDDGGKYHIIYDEKLAQANGYNRFVAAVYRMMKENPDLIEQVLEVALKASEELSTPFNSILDEKK